ncbi:dihydrolipoamide acetyltransferase family protein [Homoserinimonas sp. A520]
MAVKEFAMPDLGEGLTESELVSWNVAVGDTVELNQVIAEVETAKALVQLPSPFAGTVSQLFVEPGTTVLVGSPIVAIEVEGGEGTDASGKPVAEASPSGERNSVLVGYGPPVEGTGRPTRRARSGGAAPAAPAQPEKLGPTPPVPNGAPASVGRAVGSEPVETPVATASSPAPVKERPRSTPPVRKLAADLGIDLATVTGSGPDGLITRDDVKAHSEAPTASAAPASSRERETRTPIKGVRKHTAAAMVSSAFTAPHVSEFLTVDVTPTMELLESIKANRAFAGHRINILTVVAKAILIAISRNPSVNSRWDEAAGEIVQFGYVNLGIAAATQRGLIVPNIKDADQLDLVGLADAIGTLTETARAGSTSPADLGGGTISITNIGVFGIDAGTPILNPGEAAILAMGAIRRQPWEYQGEVALRSVMTLSLSFDHRLVDGEQGSRFLADVGTIVSNPGMILTMV